MPGVLVVLILAVWVGAIVVLVNVDRAERFLWIPTSLALAGVFSSILPLTILPCAAVITSGIILVLFIVSIAVLPRTSTAADGNAKAVYDLLTVKIRRERTNTAEAVVAEIVHP